MALVTPPKLAPLAHKTVASVRNRVMLLSCPNCEETMQVCELAWLQQSARAAAALLDYFFVDFFFDCLTWFASFLLPTYQLHAEQTTMHVTHELMQ